ncbi:MAG: hypothetical protein GY830_01410 [Bacteroidetes bacterium]|nr:hypothetical protein [Bacteroidota bacterium]
METKLSNKTTLWRYINFEKLKKMIDNSYLWFSNADKLDDRWEITPTKKMLSVALWKNHLKTIYNSKYSNKELGIHAECLVHSFIELWTKCCDYIISCWHISNQETEFFWKRYADLEEGIAIKTSIEKLKLSIKSDTKYLMLDSVKYINYDSENFLKNFKDKKNLSYLPVFFKRTIFNPENEFRAVFYTKSNQRDNSNMIDVDLNNLIEEIVVSPGAPDCFVKKVEKLCDHLSFYKNIKQSNIYEEPDFSFLNKNLPDLKYKDISDRNYLVFDDENKFFDANHKWLKYENPIARNAATGEISLSIGTARLTNFKIHPDEKDKRVIIKFPNERQYSKYYSLFTNYASKILTKACNVPLLVKKKMGEFYKATLSSL